MGCCGKGRNALTPKTKSTAAMKSRHEQVASEAAPRAVSVQGTQLGTTFQYIGSTGLTVRGPVSGKTYRFARTGSSVVVDERDAPHFDGIPSLRKTPFSS